MKPADLVRELLAYSAALADPRWRPALDKVARLAPEAWRYGGVMGVARAAVDDGERNWSPHEGSARAAFDKDQPGELVMIVPVFDFGVRPLVDLLAVHPRDADRWWLRVGAGAMLGTLDPALDPREPDAPGALAVRRTPLSFLRAGGPFRADSGFCPLVIGRFALAEAALRAELIDREPPIGALVAEDEDHADALYKWLRPRPPKRPAVPNVEIVRGGEAA